MNGLHLLVDLAHRAQGAVEKARLRQQTHFAALEVDSFGHGILRDWVLIV